MVTYLAGVGFTVAILLNAFLKDASTPKTDILSWLLIVVSSLLWFVSLPFILRKKWLAKQAAATETLTVNYTRPIPSR